jgi:hypothetical protein
MAFDSYSDLIYGLMTTELPTEMCSPLLQYISETTILAPFLKRQWQDHSDAIVVEDASETTEQSFLRGGLIYCNRRQYMTVLESKQNRDPLSNVVKWSIRRKPHHLYVSLE